MVIRAGQPWGEPGVPPLGTALARHESHLAGLWQRGLREAVLLRGTLREATGTGRTDRRVRAPVDAIRIVITGGEGESEHVAFGGIVTSAGGFRRSSAAIITNSGYWRGRRIVPAAHPNDGLLDVLEVSPEMSVAQRWMAWRRSSRMDHLPHPCLRVHRGTEWGWSGPPRAVWIDGVRHGRASVLRCTVIPDAMVLWL